MTPKTDGAVHLIIHTDGGARGNPGPAGIGVAVYDLQHQPVEMFKEYIGRATNNQAEYRAVTAALGIAARLGAAKIDFFLDSELVVKQLKGEYRIKNKELAPFVQEILRGIKHFESVTFTHVPRERNAAADKLVNEAIDEFINRNLQ